MSDDMTCGKGLAEHAVIPAKIGELIASLAENLELHMPTLVQEDPDARAEFEAYRKLVAEHREIAERLKAVAEHMALYRDLPMGKHDEQALQDPKLMEAFGRFVHAQRSLIGHLQSSLTRDQELLG